MISAGKIVDQNKKGQLILCGEGSGMSASSSCKQKVDKEYTENSSDLAFTPKAIFDDSFNLIYGNRYDGCFIDRGDGTSIDNLDSDYDAQSHKDCVIKFVKDRATVKFEGKTLNFTDAMAYLRARALGKVKIAGSMVAIPSNLKAYLNSIKAEYPIIANEAARLFYDALLEVKPQDQFKAAGPIAKVIKGHAEGSVAMAEADPALLPGVNAQMFKAYIFSVDSKFKPTILEIPDAALNTKTLGVTGNADLFLTITMRRRFVEALRVYKGVGGAVDRLSADQSGVLKILGEKLALAAKAEGKSTVSELWPHLEGKVVKTVKVDGAKNPESVEFTDATMGVPKSLLSRLHGSSLMTAALAFVWAQVVAKEPKADKAGEFQDKVVDSLSPQLDGKDPYEIVLKRVTAVDGTTGVVTLEDIPADVVGGVSSSSYAFTDSFGPLSVLGLYRLNAGKYLDGVGSGTTDAAKAKEIGDATRKVFAAHPEKPEDAIAEIFGSSSGGNGVLPSWLGLSGGLNLGYTGTNADNDGINFGASLGIKAHLVKKKKGETSHDFGLAASGSGGINPGTLNIVDNGSSSLALTDVGAGDKSAGLGGLNVFYSVEHPFGEEWTFSMNTVAGIAKMNIPDSNAGVYFIGSDGLNSGTKLLLSPQFNIDLKDKFGVGIGGGLGTSNCNLGYDAKFENADGSIGTSDVVCEGFDVAAGLDLKLNVLGWSETGSWKLWLQGAVNYGKGLSDTQAYQQSLFGASVSAGLASDSFDLGVGYKFHGKTREGVNVGETSRHNVGVNIMGKFLPTEKHNQKYNRLTVAGNYSLTSVVGDMSLGGDVVSDPSKPGIFDVVGVDDNGLAPAKTDFLHGHVAHGIKFGIRYYFMKGVSLGLENETVISSPQEDGGDVGPSKGNTTKAIFSFDLP